MEAKKFSREIREMAERCRADLFGIGPIDRFEGVPREQHPASIFPECKSVLVVGRRILRGSLRGVEEGTNFSSTYGMFGYTGLEDNFLAQTTYDLTCFLEEAGCEAVPLFGYPQEGMAKGVAVGPDKPAPNVIVDLDYAAQAAGLGEPGAGGFFLTPQFGTRQRLAMILTDFEFVPDPVFNLRLCGDCGACFAACPFAAIRPGRTRLAGVPGATRKVALVDYQVCSLCPNGAMRGPGRGSAVDRLAAACGRACMVRLEEAGKCGNRFASQFRKRRPWTVDLCNRPVEAGASAEAGPAETGCGKNFDQLSQG